MLNSWRNCCCCFFFFGASESFASRHSKLRTTLQLLHQNHQFKWPMALQTQTRYMSKVWLPENVFTRIHIKFSGWTFPTPDPLWASTLISRQLSAFWISVSTNAPPVSSKRFVQFKEGSFPFSFTVVVHCLVLQYAILLEFASVNIRSVTWSHGSLSRKNLVKLAFPPIRVSTPTYREKEKIKFR